MMEIGSMVDSGVDLLCGQLWWNENGFSETKRIFISQAMVLFSYIAILYLYSMHNSGSLFFTVIVCR